jgi:hypothetical protein
MLTFAVRCPAPSIVLLECRYRWALKCGQAAAGADKPQVRTEQGHRGM